MLFGLMVMLALWRGSKGGSSCCLARWFVSPGSRQGKKALLMLR